jgi:hypothetical protein
MIASLATSQMKLSKKKREKKREKKTPIQRLYAHKEIGIVYEVF